jgi:hypothetical protein
MGCKARAVSNIAAASSGFFGGKNSTETVGRSDDRRRERNASLNIASTYRDLMM